VLDCSDGARRFVTKSLVCVPLLDSKGRALAVLQVVNRVDGGVFTSADRDVLMTLSCSAGGVLQKLQLHRVSVRRRSVSPCTFGCAPR
jgi:hypothetical protein